ncbi:MAG: porin [Planctomycetota bacterium]|jgi:hypothetical protein
MQWKMLAAAGLCAGVAQVSGAEDATNGDLIEELRAEVAELRSTVAQMQANQNEDWLTEQRADEIRGLVQDVLADADTRASLMQDGITAGWDKNFFLQSADGNWRLRLRGQIQARYVWNHQDDPLDGENNRYGFEVRRLKIKFDGNIIDPTWKYVINLAADHDDERFDGVAGAAVFSGEGDVDLDDAVIIKDFENGLELWAGQFKMPFLQEELISSARQLAVERSLVNQEFNQDRSKGVKLAYTGDRWKLQGGFGDGFKSLNTPWNYVPLTSGALTTGLSSSVAFTGRVDWLAMGNWNQFKTLTSKPGSANGLKIGAAAHWEEDKYEDFVVGSGGRANFLSWTVDGMWQSNGWNLFAYVVGRHVESDRLPDRDQFGVVVQGGYYLTDKWEGYARYEWGDNDLPGTDDLSVVTAGANYYIHGDTVKWTTDIGVALDRVAATWRSGDAGWRGDSPDEDGQVVFRSQLQLLF